MQHGYKLEQIIDDELSSQRPDFPEGKCAVLKGVKRIR